MFVRAQACLVRRRAGSPFAGPAATARAKRFPDQGLLNKYKAALDTAIKYATVHNVKPIRGSTVVFCSVSASMREACKTARGLGAINKLMEVGVLLGLMCKYMCEECDFRLFASPAPERQAVQRAAF